MPQAAELKFQPLESAAVTLGGLAGWALEAGRQGRLTFFIQTPQCEPLRIFSTELRDRNMRGDWNGEHAGKWLHAAARAAERSSDAALRDMAIRAADYLVSLQQPDGYLGTYASGTRFGDGKIYQLLWNAAGLAGYARAAGAAAVEKRSLRSSNAHD